jgi:DNA-binding NarL/FixJ family response regulator
MRVVIAEDQVLLREGLGRLFDDAGHEVVASLGDADGLLPAIDQHEPDLVVVDIRMPPTFTDEGRAQPERSSRRIQSSGCSCSPNTSKRLTLSSWSHSAGSATCSRIASRCP